LSTRLQALLELAAELGAGDQRAHVQRQHALAAQAFRHFVVDDALRQTFDDGGLAHAGLADQHRIVLGAALQHLDGAADFLVATDHRVELAACSARAVRSMQCISPAPGALLRRWGRLHLLAAAHACRWRQSRVAACRAGRLQCLARVALVLQRRQHEQFAGDEGIAALLRQLVGEVEQAREVVADTEIAFLSAHLGQLVQHLAQARRAAGGTLTPACASIGRVLPPCWSSNAVSMRRFDHVVVAAHGQRLRVARACWKREVSLSMRMGRDPDQRRHATAAAIAAMREKMIWLGEGAATATEHLRHPGLGQSLPGQGVEVDSPMAGPRGHEGHACARVVREERIAHLDADLVGLRAGRWPEPGQQVLR
jgi:hypothetical protein